MNLNNSFSYPKTLKESDEGLDVSVLLHSLHNLYNVDENVGTYLCSKMKNFINNYRHKTRRAMHAELRNNEIISSKVNEIIDEALQESNLEKVLEYYSDVCYEEEFKDIVPQATCKIDQYSSEIPYRKRPVSISSLNVSDYSLYDKNGSFTKNNSTKKTKRAFVKMNKESHIIHLREFNSIKRLKELLIDELDLESDQLKNASIKFFDQSSKIWKELSSWHLFHSDDSIQIFYSNESKLSVPEPEDLESLTTEEQEPLLVNNCGSAAYPSEMHMKEVVKDYESSGGKRSWVTNFKLPEFEYKLSIKLEKGNVITARERKVICQTIYNSILETNIRPSAKEIRVILKHLFWTYPKLVAEEKKFGSTWDIWKSSLVNLFSTSTTPIKESSATKPNKRKAKSLDTNYQRAKKLRAGPSRSSTPKRENQEREEQSDSMHNEIVSSSHLVKLSSAMAATYVERRSQIVSEGWTIEDILVSYPWLHNEKEIFAEFSRIVGMDVAVDKLIYSGLRKIVGALLNTLKTGPKISKIVAEKEKELRKITKNSNDFEFKMGLYALPLALREDIEIIFKPMGSLYEEPIQIEYAGGEHFEEGKSFSVMIESIRVECSCLKSAIAVFFSSFFIFNLAYPSDIKKFLYFFERIILKVPGKVLPPGPVTKLVEKIQEYFEKKGETWQ